MQVAGCICEGNLKLWHRNWTCTNRCATYEHMKNLKKTWKSWLFILLQFFSAGFFFLLLLWLDCHATVVSCQEQKDPSVWSTQAFLQTALRAWNRQQPACAACDMAGHEVSWKQHAAFGPHDEGHRPPGWCLSIMGWDGSLVSQCCSKCVLAFRYWIKSFTVCESNEFCERQPNTINVKKLIFLLFSAGSTVFTTVFTSILTDSPVESKDAQLPASPWSYNRQQASERERKLERLVFMLLSHTSHTDLRSPVSECPLCEKVRVSTHPPCWTTSWSKNASNTIKRFLVHLL